MADEAPKTGAITTPVVDASKTNEENAKKVAAQDIMGANTAANPAADAGDSLDALAKAAEETAKKKADAPPVVEEKKDDAPPVKSAEDIAKEEAVVAERKRAEELFKDSPALPANASPKSSEAFTAVKVRAAQEIASREAEVEKLKKENAELAEKLKTPVPEELTKELEDHRQWRAKLDVEADPKFKEFDKVVASTHEFIYAQLRRSPVVTDETITAIKKAGGPENVNLEKLFESINDPTMKRLVEAKVADVEMAKFNKTQAIEGAKKNITEYMTNREKTFSEAAAGHNQRTEVEFNALLSKVDWFKERTIEPNAVDATKKEVAAHNEFVASTRKQLQEALRDDSPGMRAVMLVGMAQLFRLQAIMPTLKSKLETAEKQLAEATEKLEKFKKASVSHLRDGGAAPGATITTKPANLIQHAGDALDSLRDQVIAERERAGVK